MAKANIAFGFIELAPQLLRDAWCPPDQGKWHQVNIPGHVALQWQMLIGGDYGLSHLHDLACMLCCFFLIKSSQPEKQEKKKKKILL